MKNFFVRSLIVFVFATLALPVFAEETRANLDGKGNMIYLDRHHVSCGNKALSSFGLFRPTSDTIAYKYKCSQTSMGKAVSKETRANLDGGGNMIYLDRHQVDCGDKALLGFRLFRPTKTTVAYLYKCGSKPLSKVSSFETRATIDGGGNVIYLDRQQVSCGNNYITSFRLFRPTSSTVAYQYGCGY